MRNLTEEIVNIFECVRYLGAGLHSTVSVYYCYLYEILVKIHPDIDLASLIPAFVLPAQSTCGVHIHLPYT